MYMLELKSAQFVQRYLQYIEGVKDRREGESNRNDAV